ncbi:MULTISPECIES: TonB-dependent receptor plug domain-containing protein [Sphingomonas]|jgi:outer membrane receptor protein involved in Fe transport|uniref:TonB-dependent receptor n=1 Tax=Sphingomonas hankookensis TaxID=563996 RepID=A0ABR5YAU3_9SPHN|nr:MULTISPECIES: TonB-dependent receptor [Sphingomonas]KZE11858.1 TonB-dependent receptor [Sphingomonas hankookensis]PZT93242.1 MAG: TonB-dependent receptor [Sphingomonas sp.]WCP70904.1 TonB-dependent receptor [Sphingomonas hankookensis]
MYRFSPDHRRLGTATSLFALAFVLGTSPAVAQDSANVATAAPQEAPAADQDRDSSEIVVTGSRIVANGFNAPTPTTVIGEEQIANNAQPNIFNTIQQLPSLQGSTGASTGTFSTSSGTQGLSSFSLRGLQPIRTLTLLDGQRVVGANVTGVPDISMFPQLLVKRVDIVNGGASASYGSDAVGGVVNFITDTRFKGFKANVLGSITTYGDDETALVQAAYGTSLFGDRLHLIVSGEYDNEGGVGPGNYGIDLAGRRDWHRASTLLNTGITNGPGPQFIYSDFAQPYQYAKYGLINNGPLQGIAFDANGTPVNFNYGSGGVPLGNGRVSNCYPGNSFCVGGDLSGAPGSSASLKSKLERINGYGRIGYDLDATNEVYATVNIAQVQTSNQPSPGYNRPNLTVQCANPFLPQLIRDRCAAAGITSFNFGSSNGQLPNQLVQTDRDQYRFVVGAKGKVDLAGTGWTYDAYYQHGTTKVAIDVDRIVLQPRYVAATNAVVLNGAIVCADERARALGCQPINIFGNFRPSQAALDYIMPQAGPLQRTTLKQDVVSLNFSGQPVDLWAGPLSVAFGGEYRREYYRVRGDAYGAGVAAVSPNNALYPADPLLNSAQGSNWAAGNYKNGTGKYDVLEGFVEVDLPLFDSDAAGRANLNAAARLTDYSTSGTIWAWKVGGTWNTPLDGLTLRAVTSRDVRAPNLSELFAAPTVTTLPSFNDPFRNVAVQVFQNTVGNPNLKPETARDTELGIVYSRPSWLPGLSLSVDYYQIKLSGVVSSLSPDQIVRFCFEGDQTFCGGFQLDGPQGSNFVNVQPFNLASWKTSGFNLEASYQWRQPLGLPGNFTVRALGTHVRDFIVDAGIAGVAKRDDAGANSGAIPDWKWLATQTYDSGRFTLTVQERWFSDGVFNNNYVVCQTNCPVSTGNYNTVNFNKMKGEFYLDLGASFKITDNAVLYGKIDNVADNDPTPSPQTNTGLDVNPALYDTLGRTYRAGIRFNF